MHLSLHISCFVAECFLTVTVVFRLTESSTLSSRKECHIEECLSFSVFTVQFCSHAGSVNRQVELIQFCSHAGSVNRQVELIQFCSRAGSVNRQVELIQFCSRAGSVNRQVELIQFCSHAGSVNRQVELIQFCSRAGSVNRQVELIQFCSRAGSVNRQVELIQFCSRAGSVNRQVELIQFCSRAGSVNRQVELIKADDRGRLHIRLYMKDTLTGDRICINDKLVENEYAARLDGAPGSQLEAREVTDDRVHSSAGLPLTTGGGRVKVDVTTSPVVSFGRGGVMKAVVQTLPGHGNRQTPVQESPPLVSTVTKSPSPKKHDLLAEAQSVASLPKGRGLALLQGLRDIQPKVGAYSEANVSSRDMRSPLIGSVQNSADDTRELGTTQGVGVSNQLPGNGQGAVKSPSARLPTHFLATQRNAAVSTPPRRSTDSACSVPTESSQYPENRPSDIVVSPTGQAEPTRDVTVNDRSPGSGPGVGTTHRARLPTHFLAAQQKITSTASPQGRANTPPQRRASTPPSASKVRFSDSDEMQTR